MQVYSRIPITDGVATLPGIGTALGSTDPAAVDLYVVKEPVGGPQLGRLYDEVVAASMLSPADQTTVILGPAWVKRVRAC